MFTAYSPKRRKALRRFGDRARSRCECSYRETYTKHTYIHTYIRRERLNRLQSWYTTFTRISLNLFAIPRPIPFRRRAGVFHGVRGGCCCWVVCCVWAGAGGRGVSVRRSPPPAPLRVEGRGQEWGGQSSDRDGVPDGWRPRLYTHRIFSCSVHMTNPNVAQTRPHKPLNLNRHAHPNRSITMPSRGAPP